MFLPLLVDSSHNPSHPRRFHLSVFVTSPSESVSSQILSTKMTWNRKKNSEKTRLNSAKIGSFFLIPFLGVERGEWLVCGFAAVAAAPPPPPPKRVKKERRNNSAEVSLLTKRKKRRGRIGRHSTREEGKNGGFTLPFVGFSVLSLFSRPPF